jgi:eukaryotic-like serine/threonine-protein kinase
MSAFTKAAHDADETAVIAAVVPKLDPSEGRASSPAQKIDLQVGALLGKYVIESSLGAGGCGQVYGARDRESGRRVAIKVLRAEMARVPTAVPRFIREVEALSRITHDNIVQVFDVGELLPGIPYYVMELLEGMDLRQLLAVHRRVSPREALALIEPIAAALHCAHERGIIHRDVKASNVFVSEIDGKRVVKLLDFGIAKLMYGDHGSEGLTAPGTMVGTPHAMAPEQIRCEALDCRADIYSLGVLTFLLVTGTYPFNDVSTRMVTLMHLQTPPPRASQFANVPAALDDVVLKCLAKSPADRYASMPELMAALRAALDDGPDLAEGKRMSMPAIGIRLEVGAPSERELDDEMIEDISGVLDLVELALSEHAFGFPLRASNGLTAVRLVEAADREQFSSAAAQRLLATLKKTLDERASAHPDVVVSLSVREDAVECRESQQGIEFVGGPLLDTDTWIGS